MCPWYRRTCASLFRSSAGWPGGEYGDREAPWDFTALTADYTAIGKLQYIAAENQLPVLDTEYTDKVIMHLLVPNDQVGRIQKVITEATSGRIKMEKEKEFISQMWKAK